MRLPTISSGEVYTQAVSHSKGTTLLSWSSTSAQTENLLSSTTTTLTTTTMTTPTPSQKPTISTLLEALNSSLSTLNPSLNFNNHTATSLGEDIMVDGGGGEGANTPLNAPEPSLEPVTDPPPLGDNSSDLMELEWVLPIVLVTIAIMVAFAFALYHGVRKLELRMLGWCYRNCACCCAPGGGRRGGRVLRGEQYDTLSEEENAERTGGGKETVRLRDFREQSPSYGVTRKTPKEYSPKREISPCDDVNS